MLSGDLMAEDTEADDIFQIGCIGLIKAIDNFDMSFNVCFLHMQCP